MDAVFDLIILGPYQIQDMIYTYICIYYNVYVYTYHIFILERNTERERYIYTYIYIYTYNYIYTDICIDGIFPGS